MFFTFFLCFPHLDVKSLLPCSLPTRNGKKWPLLGYLPAGCYRVRTFKARFPRALCVRPIMGCSTQTNENGSARSSSQIQINVVLREVWHSTQSTIMSDPDQDFSLPCRDKVVYWHPQLIQISGPVWSPPTLPVFDAEILRLRTNGGLPLGRWPCMICVREIMMIRRDYSGRVVCWRLCPLSKDQVWGRCHQASARPRSASNSGR